MKKGVIENIKDNFSKFTKTQRLIANYICDNSRQIPSVSVQELAGYLKISDASIIRFAQMLGYKGYLEMRAALKTELNQYYSPKSRFNRTLEEKMISDSDVGSKSMYDIVAQNDFECHKDFYENFDRRFVTDVAEQINSSDTIFIAGFGTDFVPAVFLNGYMQILGYKSICCKEGDFTISRLISNIEASDLLILFSTPRYLKIEKSILLTAKEAGAKTVCIAPDSNLELSALIDIPIKISDRANELLNSYITYMSFCDMLIMAVYESNKDEIDKKLKKNEKYDKYFDLLL